MRVSRSCQMFFSIFIDNKWKLSYIIIIWECTDESTWEFKALKWVWEFELWPALVDLCSHLIQLHFWKSMFFIHKGTMVASPLLNNCTLFLMLIWVIYLIWRFTKLCKNIIKKAGCVKWLDNISEKYKKSHLLPLSR